MTSAYVVGTGDTKFEELSYVRTLLKNAGVSVKLIDIGPLSQQTEVDVTAGKVASFHPEGADAVFRETDRGRALAAMTTAFEHFVEAHRSDIAGMIGLGGSGNTALVTPGMRRLDIGVPKIMVSTVASGNVAPYVGPSDIAMMYSVVDVAGINSISRVVLGNAARFLAGALQLSLPPSAAHELPNIGLTMFGVTTTCVNYLVERLKTDYECFVFHATGVGGQTMEKLVDSGRLRGVLDVTTTEVADLLMGGVMSAGEDRLGAIARTGIPYVGSCGALDMVNFGGVETVPQQYRQRKLHVHNAQVTLMRTTPEENKNMGEWIGRKLNACEGPVRFFIPEKGVSIIDVEGMPFHDPEADQALFEALERTVVQTAQRQLIKLPLAINDPAFANAMADAFTELMRG
jgi:uncharacterized protein (UPF0261 family)